MSTEQVAKLQGLLERVLRNAARPRATGTVAAAVAAAAPPVAAAAALPVVAPPVVAPPVVAPPVVAPPVVAPLVAAATPAPAVAVPPAPPVVVAVSAPRVATPAPVAPSRAATPARRDDDFGGLLDSQRPAPPLAEVIAASADVEPLELEALADDDIVDITVEGEQAAEAVATESPDDGLEFDVDVEQPPASSRRAIASTLDEALAGVAARHDSPLDLDAPLKTPPPESGRQVAPVPAAPLQSARAPADLLAAVSGHGLEADISRPSPSKVRHAMPTLEQLGETIELDDSQGPELELAATVEATPAPSETDPDLELELPSGSRRATYDESLRPPPEAKEDLARHLEREASRTAHHGTDAEAQPISAPVVEVVAVSAVAASAPATEAAEVPPISVEVSVSPEPPAVAPAPVQLVAAPAPAEAVPSEAVAPQVVARPAAPATYVAIFQQAARTFKPVTFVELLDASLSLGKD